MLQGSGFSYSVQKCCVISCLVIHSIMLLLSCECMHPHLLLHSRQASWNQFTLFLFKFCKENEFRWSWCIICFKENLDPWCTCCIILLWKENPDPWHTCCTNLLLQGKSGSVMYLWPHLLQRKSRAMNEVSAASFWSKENPDPCFPFKHWCKNLSTKILQTLITR